MKSPLLKEKSPLSKMKSPLLISESPLQIKRLSKEEKEKLIIQKWAKLEINSIFRKTTVIRLEDFYKKYGLNIPLMA